MDYAEFWVTINMWLLKRMVYIMIDYAGFWVTISMWLFIKMVYIMMDYVQFWVTISMWLFTKTVYIMMNYILFRVTLRMRLFIKMVYIMMDYTEFGVTAHAAIGSYIQGLDVYDWTCKWLSFQNWCNATLWFFMFMELWCWTELATWDIMPWRHFVHYWPFVRGIHWSLVDSLLKGPSSQVDSSYKRPVMQSSFFVHSLSILLNKESISWWFETPWCSCGTNDWTFEPSTKSALCG